VGQGADPISVEVKETGMAKAIMFLGTGSDVGKSIAATAFCRIFKRRGFSVAPFKAQNMSNNSYVTMEGGEIGRAQVVQAEACGLLPSVHMNPVLLKPSTAIGAQIVLHGKVINQMDAADYHQFKPRLKKAVMASYSYLSERYNLIVMEGAGSCCEMNLKGNDLVNLPMALAANAPCILVADIDRGGVFAQLIGTYNLMSRKEKAITIGFLINKFRGDASLFDSGIDYIEKKTGKPVLGLVPFYHDILIDSEDSVAVQEDRLSIMPTGPDTINIAVLRLPAISNFTDIQAFLREKDVTVNYLSRPEDLPGGDLPGDYDCLIIPGTKNVMEDAVWVAGLGWTSVIRRFAQRKMVIGICGGYQLLGENILDPYGVESDRKVIKGIGLLPVETVLEKQKIVRKVAGTCISNGSRIEGYEIHMGKTSVLDKTIEPFLKIHEPGKDDWWLDGCCLKAGHIAGTYVHGIFDMPGFRTAFLNALRRGKGLKEASPRQGRHPRFDQYDLLADHFEKHCNVDRIISYV
jgi:adenosylcobyric acid synthase